MKRLNPKKLFVQYRPGVTPAHPIISRRYTLTHSDVTGELFLMIGLQYAYDKINPTRDEVLTEWCRVDNKYVFCAYAYVGGPFSREEAKVRYGFFKKEMPLALEAMRYGDRSFFKAHPELDNVPIWIYFDSVYPYFNRLEYWGTFSDYK